MAAKTQVWEGNEQLRRLLVPVGDMRTHPRNPRRGDVKAIAGSLARFGQQRPILALPDGTIVAGNHTYLAAVELGWTHVAGLRSDLSETDAEAFLAADNRISDLGTYDDDLLSKLLERLRDRDDLLATGYESEDLSALVARITRRNDRRRDPERVPEAPEVPKSVHGETYPLGPHTLVCGSCREADAWDALGESHQVLFTSPPYALGGNIRLNQAQQDSAYVTHDDDPRDWANLMAEFTAQAVPRTSVQIVNVQMLAQNKRALIGWMNDNVDRLIDLAVWNKDAATPATARGVFNSAYEFLAVFGRGAASRRLPFSTFHGTERNVLTMPPQRHNEYAHIHNATMPLDLATHVLREWVPRANSIIDPFAGVGTTMIAAELTGKSCAMIEVDPVYCDVIRQRYADYVGDQSYAP